MLLLVPVVILLPWLILYGVCGVLFGENQPAVVAAILATFCLASIALSKKLERGIQTTQAAEHD